MLFITTLETVLLVVVMTMTMITMMMMVVVILISNEIRFESDANGIKNILKEEDGMELKKI